MSMLPPASPVPPVSSDGPSGGDLVKSAWSALRTDKELIGLPVVGGISALVAVAPILAIYAFIPSDARPIQAVVGVAALLVFSVISTFFAVALAAGAHDRMSGGSPTMRSALALAWSRRRGVIGWAILNVTVGLVLRLIEDRVRGIAGVLLRVLGGVAWALASYFAIPIIAANDVGPIEALKLSSTVFKTRWRKAVRVQFRLGLYAFAVIAAAVVGVLVVVAAAQASVVLAVLLAVVIGAGVIMAMVVMSAVTAYARVALYRFAAGLPTPGFNDGMLYAAVKVKH
jgi:hypothetical protein